MVEILAIKMRESTSVRGIDVDGITFKVSQYCDDTTLFVKDTASAENAINTVRDFGHRSGLKLNLDKCDFMWLGQRSNLNRQFVVVSL